MNNKTINKLKEKINTFFHSQQIYTADENHNDFYGQVEKVREITLLKKYPDVKNTKFFKQDIAMIVFAKITIPNAKTVVLNVYGSQNLPWAEDIKIQLEQSLNRSSENLIQVKILEKSKGGKIIEKKAVPHFLFK